jgi:hypothetical protein
VCHHAMLVNKLLSIFNKAQSAAVAETGGDRKRRERRKPRDPQAGTGESRTPGEPAQGDLPSQGAQGVGRRKREGRQIGSPGSYARGVPRSRKSFWRGTRLKTTASWSAALVLATGLVTVSGRKGASPEARKPNPGESRVTR